MSCTIFAFVGFCYNHIHSKKKLPFPLVLLYAPNNPIHSRKRLLSLWNGWDGALGQGFCCGLGERLMRLFCPDYCDYCAYCRVLI